MDRCLYRERQCAVVIRIRTSLAPEENARVSATNQANRHVIRRGRRGQKREFTFSQPITNLILCHCQGRPLMSKRPFKLISLMKPPKNIFRLGQWVLQNFNTTTVLITLGQSWICGPSRRSPSKKAHLVDLKLSDKCPDTFLCYSTAQIPTIPYNLYVVTLVPCKDLPLTRLHIPVRMSQSTQRRRPLSRTRS